MNEQAADWKQIELGRTDTQPVGAGLKEAARRREDGAASLQVTENGRIF